MKRFVARESFITGVLCVLAMMVSASPVAAADPKFAGATVAPMAGTTATLFQFSVQFQPGTETTSTVSVTIAGTSFPLSRTGGPEANQIWTRSRTLPVGSWTATFSGTTVSGVNPAPVAVSPIVVTAPSPSPAPTPVPPPPATPRPTVRPTPRPTSVPSTAIPIPGASGTPAAPPSPFGTTATDPSGSPSGSGAASPDATASPSPSPTSGETGKRPFEVPVEGVIAIGLLGAVTVAAALGERRRRRAVEAFRAAEAASEGQPAAGLEEGWEQDGVDDETVATIDYEGLDEADPDR